MRRRYRELLGDLLFGLFSFVICGTMLFVVFGGVLAVAWLMGVI